MKQVRLEKLTLRNFKGIENFVLEVNGDNATVYGDNATGKTTLFDAFTWVLFDKDSSNKTQFEIKTLDERNNALHGLEHEVEVVLDVAGDKVTLRKVYAENWTKKRGAPKAEFTGHSTSYFINGVPSKKKEYTEQVAEITSEDVFKLLTNPTFFNEQLGWKERREILLDVCGDISDNEVIASKDDLEDLFDILDGKTIDEHRRIVAARRTEINKELDKIPVRIDEVKRGMPELRREGKEFFERDIAEKKQLISDKESEIRRIKSGGEVSAKEKMILEIEAEINQLKLEKSKSIYEKLDEVTKKKNDAKYKIASLDYEVSRCESNISGCEEQIRELKKEMDKLRDEWQEVNQRSFAFEHDENCPTCGQGLPQEQIQSAHEKALERFNVDKSNELETITNSGQKKKELVIELELQMERAERDRDGFVKAREQKAMELRNAEAEEARLTEAVKEVEESLVVENKKEMIERIKGEIVELQRSVYGAVEKVEGEIENIRKDLAVAEEYSSQYDRAAASKKRINELLETERLLAEEFEQLEHELHLTEEFIRTKVSMLEDRINSRFEHAKFKLFDVQVNGAINEVCETTYKGVPYSTGLNNAARINVGLDIINTLAKHFQFSAPIFIDNAEAVTRINDTDAQVVCLVVSEQDKSLRTEINKPLQEVS